MIADIIDIKKVKPLVLQPFKKTGVRSSEKEEAEDAICGIQDAIEVLRHTPMDILGGTFKDYRDIKGIIKEREVHYSEALNNAAVMLHRLRNAALNSQERN